MVPLDPRLSFTLFVIAAVTVLICVIKFPARTPRIIFIISTGLIIYSAFHLGRADQYLKSLSEYTRYTRKILLDLANSSENELPEKVKKISDSFVFPLNLDSEH